MTTESSTIDAPENPQTPETPTAPKPDPAPDAPAPKEPSAGKDTGDHPASPPADPNPAPADKGELQTLREMLAGGDEGLLKSLERYKSTEAISKAFREARAAAKNVGKPLRLGDKATEDEIKAYREAVGIPEDAKDYPVDFREDYKATDADKEVLGEFRAAMHERNVDPKASAAMLEWYQDYAQAQQQALDGNLAAVAKKTQAELRAEWGGEYDGNIGAVREFMTAQLGEDGFNRMMGMRLMDGSRLQDDPAFVKMMAQVSTDYYGSNAIFNGDIETTSKTVQERIDELMKLRGGDAKQQEEYFSDKVQGELSNLYRQRDKIAARKG